MEQNPKWISAKEAAQLLGYAPEYVAYLCRTKKLDAKREGSGWTINEESLRRYKQTAEEQKAIKDAMKADIEAQIKREAEEKQMKETQEMVG